MPLRFKPKLGKIVELLLYLAHKKPGADKYQAVKFLYLADREHFNRHGRPITFETYYALDYGPVATNALDLLNGKMWAFRREGIVDVPFRLTPDSRTTYISHPSRDVNFDLFSKSDIRVFDEVVAEYGSCSFDELFNITHEHFAYKRAWDEKPDFSGRGLMKYEEMLEGDNKESILADMELISENVR